jgi:hypothetical protein
VAELAEPTRLETHTRVEHSYASHHEALGGGGGGGGGGAELTGTGGPIPVAGLVYGRLQRKLSVGSADDVLEREADDMAAQVVAALRARRTTAAPDCGDGDGCEHQVGRTTAVLRRASSPIGADGGEASADVERAIGASRGHGSALPVAIRRDLEDAFGADFGAVRLHSGSRAQQLNDQLSARAFTVGGDIFFRDGMPDVTNRGDQLLLAHELAHTVQQGAAARRSTRIQRLPQDAAYKEMTGGDSKRERIATLDGLMAAYNTAKGIDAKRDELDKILVECDNYLALPGHSSRKTGVATIKRTAQHERDAITAYENAAGATGKAAMKFLLDAIEGYNKADADGGNADYLFTPIDKAITDLKADMRKTPQGQKELDELIEEDVDRLAAMSTDPATPKVLHKILVEIIGNRPKITYGEGGAGATQTPGGPSDYKVTSPVGLSGGSAERLSSLTHEMTHVSIGETFDNTAILLAYSQTYTDTQVRKLAAKRLEIVNDLQKLATADKTFVPRQRALINTQLGYMKQDKMLTYVTNFEKAGKLPATDAAKLKLLAPTVPFSSLLIEYDTVINQLLLLMHTWEIPRSNAFYKKVEKAADEAYKHRETG